MIKTKPKRYSLIGNYNEDLLEECAEACMSSLTIKAHNHYLQEMITLIEKNKNNPMFLTDIVAACKREIVKNGGVVDGEPIQQSLGLFDSTGHPI